MTSQAERLRSKRIKQRQYAGRPAKEGVERYPGGQIKHTEREKEVRAVAIEARQRVYFKGKEVSNDMVSSPYAGYVLGRLFLDGRITECEREAGDAYATQMVRYYGLTGISFPSARAQSLFSIKGFDGETTSERARMAREASNRMMALEGTLLRLEDGPRVKTTIYNTCLLDLEIMRTMPDAQLLWLKRGLKELHFQLGLAKSKEAV
ncbi:hypothetical protein FA04_14610 [Ensifer adhaerens]|uniref:Uncharacterized protein n=1 Tax=Ensifer adhaerens TaxID=106592 RepID=A0ABY8HE62_ENSAD|nr:hypothetical protein [Ensifer adhaerens]ANK73743.1 hypothetical protein FA04_14610 [Ensifer adhaerens]KDP70295.1 hypothetical protein FA04_29090 [Ensifer adhaerens]WFP89830.1 hypothetical protein P4B07_14850 [Ensifer adhaerens]